MRCRSGNGKIDERPRSAATEPPLLGPESGKKSPMAVGGATLNGSAGEGSNCWPLSVTRSSYSLGGSAGVVHVSASEPLAPRAARVALTSVAGRPPPTR